jgi:hypothetical protein
MKFWDYTNADTIAVERQERLDALLHTYYVTLGVCKGVWRKKAKKFEKFLNTNK